MAGRIDDIRRAVKSVQLAKQDMVQKYDYQIQVVLGVLNSPEALVTDESTVGDFIKTGEDDIDKARLTELADTFNCDVGMTTPVWELARAICWEDCIEYVDTGDVREP